MPIVKGSIRHMTPRDEGAMLAEHGTQLTELTAESVYEEALRACSPPERKTVLAQQLMLDGTVDESKKARNRHGPVRRNAFLKVHIKAAFGDPAKLLQHACEERSLGVPPVCYDPHHARLYGDPVVLAAALVIARRKKREMIDGRR